MQKDETITQALRRLIVEDGFDPEVAAKDVVETGTRARLAEAVLPLVVDAARTIKRSYVRDLERRVFSPRLAPDESKAPDPDRMTRPEAIRRLNDEGFPGVDGWVAWDQATVSDHHARADWQRGHAAASVQDAERHEKAAALIEEHDVDCLGDIENWADLL